LHNILTQELWGPKKSEKHLLSQQGLHPGDDMLNRNKVGSHIYECFPEASCL